MLLMALFCLFARNEAAATPLTATGVIAGDQVSNGPYTPSRITSVSSATSTGSVVYQWQSTTTPAVASSWTAISGATAAAYSPGYITQTTYYRRAARVSSNSGTIWLGFSNIVTKAVTSFEITTPAEVYAGSSMNLTSSGSFPAFYKELIANGDFNADMIAGFSSNTASRSITYNPNTAGYNSFFDYTSGNSDGKMLVGKGQSYANHRIIYGAIPVTAGRTYSLSAYARAANNSNVPVFKWVVEGYAEGSNVTLSTSTWRQVSHSFTATSTGNVVIGISNSTGNSNGNVFALDEVSVIETSPVSYNWSGPGRFSNNSANPVISAATGENSGDYSLNVSMGDLGTQVTKNIRVVAAPVSCELSLSLSSPVNVSCFGGTNGSFTATGANGFGGTGEVSMQYWENIGGYALLDLTENTAYKNNTPSSSFTLTQAETATNRGDNFGGRMRGYIVPRVSGTYYFWIASDDYGKFLLSTSQNPADTTLRASVSGYTSPREWSKYPSQKSAAITLVAGQIYYFEALYKEAGGGDNLAIGWSRPGESTAAPSEVIPGTVLRPFVTGADTAPVYQYSINEGAYQNSGTFSNLAAGSYTVTVKDTYGCTKTGAVTITQPTQIMASPSSNTPVCEGNTLTLSSGTVSGGPSAGGYSYQWTGPAGYTSAQQNPSIANATLARSGTYTLVVTKNGCSATFTTQVNIVSKPTATVSFTNPSCGVNDGTITLTFPSPLPAALEITLNGGSPYTVSAASGSYMITGLAAGSRNISMRWATGTACETSQGSANLVTGGTIAAPAISTTTPDLCAGGSFTLNSGLNAGHPYQLQWQELNGSTWTDIASANGISYTRQQVPAGDKSYRLQVSLSGCSTVFSDVLTIRSLAQATVSIGGPGPAVCLNQTVLLNSTLSGGAGNATYQWRRSADGVTNWTDISGAVAATYSAPTQTAGTNYYMLVVSLSGPNCNAAVSEVKTISVVNPSITLTPASTTLCEGGTQTLTSNDTYGRVWQRWTESSNEWTDIPSVTSPSYTPAHPDAGTYKYRIRVNVPACGVFYSSEATITVRARPVVRINATNPVVCKDGASVLSASLENMTGTASYQWLVATSSSGPWENVSSGGTGSSYTLPTSVIGPSYYKLRVSSSASGCGPVESEPFTFRVVAQPTVSISRSSPFICLNSSNTLTVTVNNGVGPFTYQWQSSASQGSGYSNISGATSATYQLPTGTLGTRYYQVVVTSAPNTGCAGVTSSPETVTVLPLPSVTASNTSGDPGQCLGTIFKLFGDQSSGSPVNITGYSWAGPAGFSSTEQYPLATATHSGMAGVYTVTATGSNNCTNTAVTTLKIETNCDGKCTDIIDVKPINPTCTGSDGSIVIDEFRSSNQYYYQTSMNGKDWNTGSFTYSGLGVGRHLVFLRDRTSGIICRTVYITLEAKNVFTGSFTVTNATGCKVANGSIRLPSDVLSTDQVAWISSRNLVFVPVSSLTNRTIPNLSPGTYYVRVTRGGEFCYREQMVTVGNGGTPCISNAICTSTNLVNLFPNGDFGSGTAKHGPILSSSETQYGYSLYNCSAPNDGFYSIVNTTDCDGLGGRTFGGSGGVGGWNVLPEDHTPGDTGGYMMVVNASHNPDIVIEKSISNLCPRTQYNFTAWIYNLIPNEQIKPNLSFLIDGVVYYVTGNITTSGWQQVGFSFTTGATTSSVFSIRNNAPGGNGNDWVIDDIVVNKCPLQVTMSNNIMVCEGSTETQTITATVTDPYREYTFYKWQESRDGGITWTDMDNGVVASGVFGTGNVMEVKRNLEVPFTLAMNGRRYRIRLANQISGVDDAVCSALSPEVSLTVTQVAANLTPSVEKCEGATVTTLVVSASGGTAPYTYSWSNGLGTGTSKTVTPSQTTTYTVNITDSKGCTATASTTITVKKAPSATVTGTTICSGETFTVTPSSTTQGVQYTWTAVVQTAPSGGSVTGFSPTGSGAPVSQTLVNSGTTNAVVRYTLTPAADGCSGTPVSFDVVVKPAVTINASNAGICSGTAFSITPSVNLSGAKFTWTATVLSGTVTGMSDQATAVNGPVSQTLVNTGTTDGVVRYMIRAVAGDCNSPAIPVDVTVRPGPKVVKPADIVVCHNAVVPSVIFSSNVSGASFTWINSLPAIGLSGSGSGNLPSFTAVNNGNTPVTSEVRVSSTVNGCAGEPVTFTITVMPQLKVNLNLNAATVCLGTPLKLAAGVSGGAGAISYQWQVSANEQDWTDLSGLQTDSLHVPTGNASVRFYRVIVSAAGSGCNAVTSATARVEVIPAVTIRITPADVKACKGEVVILEATINNATQGITYQWQQSADETNFTNIPGANTLTYQAPTAITGKIYYRLEVASPVSGCGTVKSGFVPVEVRSLPAVSLSHTDGLCLPSTGKISIQFSDDPIESSLEFSIDGGLTYPYQVNDNIGSYAISNLPAGTYQVWVRWGGGGCPVNAGPVTIADRPAPVVTVSKADPVCSVSNGSITFSFADVAGRTGYQFSLDGGLTYKTVVSDQAGAVTYNALAPGTYSLWVKWENGDCPVNLSTITLTDQQGPAVSLGTDLEICAGTTITLSAHVTGGTPALQYTWNQGLGSVLTHQITPGTTTSYILKVTDANNCTASDTVKVTVNANPVAVTADVEVCENQFIRLSSSGGETYRWTGPDGFNALVQNPEIQRANLSLHQGNYTVTVTNAKGCSAEAVAHVLINALPAPPQVTGDARCGPGSVTLGASGCDGQISWHDRVFDGNIVGVGTTFASSSLSETTSYFVSCTSTKSCVSPVRSSVQAKINPFPLAETIAVDPTCSGSTSANNGRIIITRYREGEKFSFHIGSSYNAAIASTPVLIPPNGTIATALPNPADNVSQLYTIRIISAEGCTVDRTAMIRNRCEDCPVEYCPPAVISKTE